MMRFVTIFLFFILIYASGLPADDALASTPVAVIPEAVFEFTDAIEGEYVTHDFVIHNQGDTVLNILKVKTSCGCTTASIPDSIPPGGKDIVSIKLRTKGYGGRSITKTATVITDDPENEKIPLTIKGKVVEIYSLSAKSVKLQGNIGEPLKAAVRMLPSKAYPFKVKELTAKRGENIRFQLEEIVEDGAPGYKITVENTATKAGVYFDTLYLKTDSDQKPDIEISVVGNIRKAEEMAAENEGG